MKARDIIDKLAKQERLIVNAQGRQARVTPGTATHRKHHEDFIRHREKFDELIASLREALR
jgi:hypothetical protein